MTTKNAVAKAAPATGGNQSLAVMGEMFGIMLAGAGLKVEGLKAVTRPVLTQTDGQPIIVKVEGPIRVSGGFAEEVTEKGNGEERQKPADVMPIINMETGEEMILIANAALKSAMLTNYPDDGYVGKYFGIVSRLVQHKGTKRIREYMIKELVVSEGAAD